MTVQFAERADLSQVEEGTKLAPKFDEAGLVTAVAQDADTGEVLMVAFMNDQALQRTIETGEAHFYSRSRGKQWKKGEESGNVLRVKQMLTDCDQDCIVMRVKIAGNGAACHNGYRSCFYRAIPTGSHDGPLDMTFTELEKLFDPKAVYGKK